MRILIIFAFIAGIVFLRNKYRNKRNDIEIKKITSGKISAIQLLDELHMFYSKKVIPDSTEFYTINSIEQMMLPLIGTNIKKEKYKLSFIKKLNDNNILFIIEASINDFVPGSISIFHFNYKRPEFHKYILRLDENNKQIFLYSDSYADLQMKLNKDEVARILIDYF